MRTVQSQSLFFVESKMRNKLSKNYFHSVERLIHHWEYSRKKRLINLYLPNEQYVQTWPVESASNNDVNCVSSFSILENMQKVYSYSHNQFAWNYRWWLNFCLRFANNIIQNIYFIHFAHVQWQWMRGKTKEKNTMNFEFDFFFILADHYHIH